MHDNSTIKTTKATYMKYRNLALSVSNNHENCIQQLDVLCHVIYPKSVLHKRIFFHIKKRPRPISGEGGSNESNGVKTNEAACKVINHESLLNLNLR